MEFVFDPAKEVINTHKHGLDFSLVPLVFADPLHVVVPDRHVDGEDRWHALGVVGGTLLLLVVHSYPDPDDDQRVRVIGLRKATSHERRRYESDAY
jgi:uncharacterized DUF497 family protein